MATYVNVAILAGPLAVAPQERTTPAGEEVWELKVSQIGERALLPLPVEVTIAPTEATDAERGRYFNDRKLLQSLQKGDAVLVQGKLIRRFYRNGGGARSVMLVRAETVKKLDKEVED